MAFVTLEDETGICESVWFPDAYRRCGIHSERGGPFRVRGRIAVDFGVPILQVDQAFAAEENRNISGRTATDSTTRTDQATVPTGPS
jgi:DNA polymerase III alpha subunit